MRQIIDKELQQNKIANLSICVMAIVRNMPAWKIDGNHTKQ